MTPEDPRHGTEWGNVLHYRLRIPQCEPCLEARRLAQRRRGKLRTAGKQGRMALGAPLHEKLLAAAAGGARHIDIAAASGICESTIDRIIRGGPQVRVAVVTKARLAQMHIRTEISPIGYTRRLQALACLGYSCGEFARAAGINQEGVKKTRRRPPKVVKAEVRAAILDAYNRLSMNPHNPTDQYGRAQATAARTHARKNGWVPPLAWDNIDDPDETPTDWEYKRSYGNQAEDLRELVTRGLNIHQVCRELHRSRKALEKWCSRNGMTDQFLVLTSRAVTNENQYAAGEAVA